VAEASEGVFALLERDVSTGLRVLARDTDVTLAGGVVAHALDASGRRHLLIPLAEGQPSAEDTTSRGVTIRPRSLLDAGEEHRYLDVSCELSELRDLFAIVCDEMLARLRQTPHTPGAACKSVLDRWRNLLIQGSTPLLGRAVLAGLLAELHFLERLAALTPSHAVEFWTGPGRSRFDFSGEDISVEVKATTLRERLEAEIHGVTQLDPPSGVTLFLRLERMELVSRGGDSVPGAVGRLRDAGVDTAALTRGLSEYGYSMADSEAYDKIRFRTLEERYYRVDDQFPHIKPSSFVDPLVLERVTKLRYTVDLTNQPPVALEVSAIKRLLSQLARPASS
jgi:Putative  PD-(D/E)XK family member, (DUF4420)